MSEFHSSGSLIKLIDNKIHKIYKENYKHNIYGDIKNKNELFFYEKIANLFNTKNKNYLIKYYGYLDDRIILEYIPSFECNIQSKIDMITSIHLQFWNDNSLNLKFGHLELNNLISVYNEFVNKVKLNSNQLRICNNIIFKFKNGYYNLSKNFTLTHGDYWNKNILNMKIIDWQYANLNRCTDDLVLFILGIYDPNDTQIVYKIKNYYYNKISKKYSRSEFEDDFKKSILIPFIFSMNIKLMDLAGINPTNNNANLYINFFNFYENFIEDLTEKL